MLKCCDREQTSWLCTQTRISKSASHQINKSVEQEITLRSLFLKIFLWFWAIQALIFLAMYAYWSMQPDTGVQTRWHSATSSAVTLYGQAAAEEADRYGQTGIDNFFSRLKGSAHLQAALLDENGKVLAGTVPAEARDLVTEAKNSSEAVTAVKDRQELHLYCIDAASAAAHPPAARRVCALGDHDRHLGDHLLPADPVPDASDPALAFRDARVVEREPERARGA